MNLITRHQHRALIADLLTAPQTILDLQAALEITEREYTSMLAHLTLRAWMEPLFPPKKDGDPMRPAGNEEERRLAVQIMCQRDPDFLRITAIHEDVQRRLSYARNRLEAARIVSRLIGEPQQ